MHIVHLVARLNDGGPARVIRLVARHLLDAGDQVTVVHGRCPSHEPDLAPDLAADGIPLRELPGLGPAIRLWTDTRLLLRLLLLLRRLRPDLLHTHTAKAGLLGRLAARLLGIPCLHSYHGHVLRGYFSPRRSRLILHLERLVSSRAHHHALATIQAAELCWWWRIGAPRRWRVLANPVAIPRSASASWQEALRPDLPVVLFLGRLAAVKDLPLFFVVCDHIERERPIQVLICGDGEESAAVAQRAAACSYPVCLPGCVPAGEALARADLLLLTSRNEGQPLTVIEAAGAGVPVVAPCVGGLRQWRGDPGLVLVPRSTPDLAAACLDLLGDASRRQAVIAAGRRLAARHSPERLLPRYRDLYRELRRPPAVG